MWETWVQSLGWEDPLQEGMPNQHNILCLENPHGQRSLVGYSPRGRKELDTKHSTEKSCKQVYCLQISYGFPEISCFLNKSLPSNTSVYVTDEELRKPEGHQVS